MENKLETRIVEVTVYPDRALINRQIDVELTDETSEIVFYNMPSSIYRDTIRVSGKGDAVLQIEGIDIRDEYIEVVRDEDIRLMEDELEKYNDEYKAVNTAIELCNKDMEFLTGLRDVTSSRLPVELYFNKTNTEETVKLINLFKSNIEKINSNLLELYSQKHDIEKKIARLENELSQKSNMRSKEIVNCHITIKVEKAGKFSFYLSYVIQCAGWSPVYDARLFLENKEVEISYFGEISQSTGEEWDEVSLFLSTAKPSVSASLPEMQTWFIDFDYDEYDKSIDSSFPASADYQHGAYEPGEYGRAEETEAAIGKGLSITFGIKEKLDLPPDGTNKKVLIARKRFPVELDYRACPKLAESVFIRGTFENSTDYPLLGGNVKVYHDQVYIGDSYIDTVIPGETFKLSLGVDESVTVKRELLIHFTQKKGVTGGYTRTVYKYRIKVKNFKEAAIDLLIEENIPISQSKELKVELTEVTNKAKPDDKGILSWNLNVLGHDKKDIDIEYYVEYPIGKTLSGMDV